MQGVEGSTERLIRRVVGDYPADLRVEVYDGTVLGPSDARTTVRITSSDFFQRIAKGRASELAFARAYVSGDIEVHGDIYGLVGLRDQLGSLSLEPDVLRDVAHVLGIQSVRDIDRALKRLPPPPEEIVVKGRLHSLGRDAQAVSSHYDVSNRFYRLFLGSTMTYSCALYEHDDDTLDQAQVNKYDLICRKLDLQPGMRLLDVGCGWGGMLMHAAQHYGVKATGITISQQQLDLAQKRVAEAGLTDQVEVRLQDYRDVNDGPFDAVSSIGMFEHVGQKQLGIYFGKIQQLLVPGGRLLNHAINRSVVQRRARVDPDGFVGRYVFPDGELLEPGQVVTAMSSAGLEVRHMESLREHYAKTLRTWVASLEENWETAVEYSSLGRARIWRLYMAACAVGFETNEFNLTQILATKTVDGRSGFDTRSHW